MRGFVGYLRRGPRGKGFKSPRSLESLTAIPKDTSERNFATYFNHLPRRFTSFVIDGSAHTHPQSRADLLKIQPHLKSLNSRHFSLNSSLEDDISFALYGASSTNSATAGGSPSLSVSDPSVPVSNGKKSEKITINTLKKFYRQNKPITMVTAYDYPTAQIADSAGVDMLLVGDSLGMVVLGYDTTVSVTMDEMLHHSRAANRGRSNAFLVADLPFGSYLTEADALHNSARLLKEGGVDAVKLEGGERVADHVRAVVDAGMAVVGHVGLTPQAVSSLGGFRCQAKSLDSAQQLLQDALALQAAGAFMIVLECVPAEVAKLVTAQLSVPTIGIGAGPHVSGQVQVFHDLVGLFDKFVPKFAHQYLQANQQMTEAVQNYNHGVESGEFPSAEHSFAIKPHILQQFTDSIHSPNATNTTDATSGHHLNDQKTQVGGRYRRKNNPQSCDNSEKSNHHTTTMSTGRESNNPKHRLKPRPHVNLNARSFSSSTSARTSLSTPPVFNNSLHRHSTRSFSNPAAGPNEPCDVLIASSIQECRDLCQQLIQQFSSLNSGAPHTEVKPHRLGFVPTMGALHSGHLSLVERAKEVCDVVVVSIFVNPLQFLPHEDFEKYPRPLSKDLEALRACGVHLAFTPAMPELYPDGKEGFGLRVNMLKADSRSEGSIRPGFFCGVATVCTKLFNIVQPDAVFFGQKDGQQCVVIGQVVRELNMPIHVYICPTLRDPDGLAQSSRNVYLSQNQRQAAPVVYQSLQEIKSQILAGNLEVKYLREKAIEVLSREPSMEIQYLSISRAYDLEPLLDEVVLELPAQNVQRLKEEEASQQVDEAKYIVQVAVSMGPVRLIDNILL